MIGDGQNWYDEDCLPFADEYDSYLMEAAERLRRGDGPSNVANYLVKMERQHMGLSGPFAFAIIRAERTVAAIQADTKLCADQD